MNMRQRKRYLMAAMYYIAANAAWDRWINKVLKRSPEEIEAQKKRNRAEWEEMVHGFLASKAPLPKVEKVYKVARVKDDVVVAEFPTLEQATAEIEKAARQKKAKLVLLDNEPYVFEA